MLWQAIGILALAYLVGSFPTAYLVGRRRRIDIHQVGSGTGGAANVWTNVSRRWGIAVALTDFVKGLLAVFIATLAGADNSVQWGAALAAIAGHNWSVFLRLRGGRGIVTAAGALSLLAPVPAAVAAGFGLLLATILSLPVGALVGIAALPLVLLGFGQAPLAVLGSVSVLVLVALKRLAPGHSYRASDSKGARIIAYRLLLDRDTKHKDAWIRRPWDSASVHREQGR